MRALLILTLGVLVGAGGCSKDADRAAPGPVTLQGQWRQVQYRHIAFAADGTMSSDETVQIPSPSYPMGFTFTKSEYQVWSDALPTPGGAYTLQGSTIWFVQPQTAIYQADTFTRTIKRLTPTHLTLQSVVANGGGGHVITIDDFERR